MLILILAVIAAVFIVLVIYSLCVAAGRADEEAGYK